MAKHVVAKKVSTQRAKDHNLAAPNDLESSGVFECLPADCRPG